MRRFGGVGSAQECLAEPGGPRIWTPHPGGFRRFATEKDVGEGYEQKRSNARRRCIGPLIVLKGTARLSPTALDIVT